jgi:hypothetical protein
LRQLALPANGGLIRAYREWLPLYLVRQLRYSSSPRSEISIPSNEMQDLEEEEHG